MKQIFIIHGGDSFSSYEAYRESLENSQIDYERLKRQRKWKTWLAEHMTDADVLLPSFPNGNNAVFDEWAIYFEKLIPFFGDDVRLVGHSLGAMFLVKYLQGHPMKQKVRQLVLIASGYDDDRTEDYGSFKVSSATNLPVSAEEVHLLHSKDDFVVPFTELAKFQADLPDAMTHVFENRGHFLDETFPELLTILQEK
jgi:predicted alpha/beta hydrolase family esterase